MHDDIQKLLKIAEEKRITNEEKHIVIGKLLNVNLGLNSGDDDEVEPEEDEITNQSSPPVIRERVFCIDLLDQNSSQAS